MDMKEISQLVPESHDLKTQWLQKILKTPPAMRKSTASHAKTLLTNIILSYDFKEYLIESSSDIVELEAYGIFVSLWQHEQPSNYTLLL